MKPRAHSARLQTPKTSVGVGHLNCPPSRPLARNTREAITFQTISWVMFKVSCTRADVRFLLRATRAGLQQGFGMLVAIIDQKGWLEGMRQQFCKALYFAPHNATEMKKELQLAQCSSQRSTASADNAGSFGPQSKRKMTVAPDVTTGCSSKDPKCKECFVWAYSTNRHAYLAKVWPISPTPPVTRSASSYCRSTS